MATTGGSRPSNRTRRGGAPPEAHLVPLIAAAALVGSASCRGPTLDLGHDDAALLVAGGPVLVVQGGHASFTVTSTLNANERLDGTPVLVGDGSDISALSPKVSSTPDGRGAVVTVDATAATAGTYSARVTATMGSGEVRSDPFPIVVGVGVNVSTSVDMKRGATPGHFHEFVGTSFQPAEWQDALFTSTPGAMDRLQALAPSHVVVQLMNGGAIPLLDTANPAAPSPTDWDFTNLDAIMQKLLPLAASGTQIELQIATIPTALSALPTAVLDGGADNPQLDAYAQYCANLVRYYNAPGGFTWAGKKFASPSGIHVPWWAVYSDPNGPYQPNGYAALYSAAVGAMHAVDPNIHFAAFEFNDYQTPFDQGNPSWIEPALVGMATQPIDAVSLHLFGTSSYKMTDAELFAEVPAKDASARSFVNDIAATVSAVQTRLGVDVPIWITESNVNSDYPLPNGLSNDNAWPFTVDARGTGPFFAAWRPYVFSQLGKAGAQGLVHWSFTSGQCPQTSQYCTVPEGGLGPGAYDTDTQNAEVSYETGEPFLSYWVDATLARMYPASSSPGPKILITTTTEADVVVNGAPATPSIEVLATQNDDRSILLMIVDIAPDPTIAPPRMNPGSPRTVVLDLSSVLASGAYTAQVASLDASTMSVPTFAPAPAPAAGMPYTLTLGGYGVQFLLLTPSS